VTRLLAGRSGIRIPAGSRNFSLLQIIPAYCSVDTEGFSPGGKSGRDVRLTSHIRLVPGLRMSGAVPPLPIYAFMACTGTASWPFQLCAPLRSKVDHNSRSTKVVTQTASSSACCSHFHRPSLLAFQKIFIPCMP